MNDEVVSIRVSPEGYLDILSQEEVNNLLGSSKGGYITGFAPAPWQY